MSAYFSQAVYRTLQHRVRVRTKPAGDTPIGLWLLLLPLLISTASERLPNLTDYQPRVAERAAERKRAKAHALTTWERAADEKERERESKPAVSFTAVCCCSSRAKAAQFELGCLVTQLANNSECNWLIMLPIKLKQLNTTSNHAQRQNLMELQINCNRNIY